ALTTCASERMKTQRFSYFADFAARERMREAKPVKLKKVAFSHFFDTLGQRKRRLFLFARIDKQGGISYHIFVPCETKSSVGADHDRY
ncbi:MAG: hypothetical protein U0N50_03810, partial [Christensenellales bacterium]